MQNNPGIQTLHNPPFPQYPYLDLITANPIALCSSPPACFNESTKISLLICGNTSSIFSILTSQSDALSSYTTGCAGTCVNSCSLLLAARRSSSVCPMISRGFPSSAINRPKPPVLGRSLATRGDVVGETCEV